MELIAVKITAPSEVANSFNRMNRRASSFVQRQKRSGSLLSPTTPSRRSSEVQSIIQSNFLSNQNYIVVYNKKLQLYYKHNI